MKNNWTGGQYSIFRGILGSYLFVHFIHLLPWASEIFSNQGVLPQSTHSPLIYCFPNILAICDTPLFLTGFLLIGVVSSLGLTVGWKDRFSAVVIWYILTCLNGRNPLISNPSIPYIGWILLAHACIPFIPYGSWKGRGRIQEVIKWNMPFSIFNVAWIILAISYTYSGYTKLISPSWIDGTAIQKILDNPLARPTIIPSLLLLLPPVMLKIMTWGALGAELLFAPIAIFRMFRPWIWLFLLIMHISLMLLIDFADLSFAMILMHFFTFDPGWIKPKRSKEFYIFYDSACGMCNRFVRLVLIEDQWSTVKLAPLLGETFQKIISKDDKKDLPDSIIIYTDGGKILFKSEAIIEVLFHLGGVWKVLGYMIYIIPRSIRDILYDVTGRYRYQIFPKTKTNCPLLPGSLTFQKMLS